MRANFLREAGRDAYFRGELATAEQSYRRALSSKADSIPAWEGLACVQMGSSDFQSGVDTYSRLVSLTLPLSSLRLCKRFETTRHPRDSQRATLK